MTTEAVRRKSTRAASRDEHGQLPIGEVDANIFNCPACARPLGVGTRRCPGCRTRLVAGVRATRAAGFTALGLMIGLVVGGAVMTAVATLTRPAAVAVVDTTPVVLPSSVPVAAAQPPVVEPVVPASALSALRQSSLLNQRLVTDAAKLTAALATAEPSSVEIARSLRALAANAAFGDRIAPDVAGWSDGAVVSAGLVDFYAVIGATAREGLASSLNNTAAYVRAGRLMLAVMDDLPALDAAARALASSSEPAAAPPSPAPVVP